MTCSVETKLFEPCPKGRERTQQGGLPVPPRPRLRCACASFARRWPFCLLATPSVATAATTAAMTRTRRADNNQLAYTATLNAAANAMHMVAPAYELGPWTS